MSASRPTISQLLKWHRNGVEEQRTVDELLREILPKFVAVLDELDGINKQVADVSSKLAESIASGGSKGAENG